MLSAWQTSDALVLAHPFFLFCFTLGIEVAFGCLLVKASLAVIKLKEEDLKSVKLCLEFCVALKSSKATAKRKQIKEGISTFSWGKEESITSSIAAKKDNKNSDLGNKGA